jgi:cysteate synthase
MKFEATGYKLQNVATGRVFDDAGWTLDDPEGGSPALIRAIYEKQRLADRGATEGIYRYGDWLPLRRVLKGSASPVTWHSRGLGPVLGLENLYITFSGYFPQKGAMMTTCSFKETEAYSVCGRMSGEDKRVLVVASAGNTARAFAKVCSQNGIPLLLCVPEDNLDALWFEEPLDECVKLIAAAKGGDYFDAIHLGNLVLSSPRFYAEGGAKNIARRDGMGTTVLNAATTIGRIPDHYFQAVGSGTGAIAAWEANMRLIADGRYGSNTMRLAASQNHPFVPIHEAWRADSRDMLPYEDTLAREHAGQIDAKVLSNRKPPYGIAGGLYDALKATGGDILTATNAEGRAAAALFLEKEGVDIHPAAAIATATLIARAPQIPAGETVMLNITGGGEELFRADRRVHRLRASIVFPLDAKPGEVAGRTEKLFD